MSSSPPVRSLRTRLLAGQIALLAVVCLGIAAVTEAALYRYLLGELDGQLMQITQRVSVLERRPTSAPAAPAPSSPAPRTGLGPAFLDAPGQPIGMVAAAVRDGTPASAGVLNVSGEREPLSPAAAAQLTAAADNTNPVSVKLDGLGGYRVASTPGSDSGNKVAVGLSMRGMYDTLARVALIFGIGTLAALIIATLAGRALIRRALAPLDRVAATAGSVAGLSLDRGEVAMPMRVAEADANPDTEVGRLGLAVNRMLDHLAAALSARQANESRVRQFVADASHELRTPLTAIRGYTELAQRKRADVPADVAHALGRVESEARRMTYLVEDLLLLARLDSGRPLEQRPVDLTALCLDAVSDAHAAGPGHHWNLDVPDEPVLVVGDEARLHQVLANLLANARVHTPGGTSVTVSLGSESGAAVLRVTDDGPGIPVEAQPDVFERFARANTGRSHQAGSTDHSTGLGLAIASAVVHAHHGDIALRSEPGSTEFIVRLPLSRLGEP